MKLWLLTARRDLPHDDDPWEPWYDKAFGFVIRAESEKLARKLVWEGHGNEVPHNVRELDKRARAKTAWLNPAYSKCERLMPGGKPEVILVDFHAA